jgi:hypothetical protein
MKTAIKKDRYPKEVIFFPQRLIIIISFVRVRNSGALHRTFNVEPLYLQHENSGMT